MSLQELREEVKSIDQDIVQLVARRLCITQKIGEEKRQANIPLRNWEVEKEVMDNAIKMADISKIPQELVKTIMYHLLHESRIQQEKIRYSSCRGDPESILIIGGLGEMGKWFCYFFQNQGHDVSIYDIKGTSQEFKSYVDLGQALKGTTYTLIATPLDEVPMMIETIADSNYRGFIFDIASFKGHLADTIELACKSGAAIASIHPMFGATARTLSDKVICICDCGHRKATENVRKLFQNTAASLITVSLEEHDRLISHVLGLSHLVNIVFIKALMKGGYTYEELLRVASTTFLSQIKTAFSVINENPALYYAIQRLNPFKQELFDNLKMSLHDVVACITQGKGVSFVDIIEKEKGWLNAE
jgi:chorismate mutase/prephenate dehydrogenase